VCISFVGQMPDNSNGQDCGRIPETREEGLVCWNDIDSIDINLTVPGRDGRSDLESIKPEYKTTSCRARSCTKLTCAGLSAAPKTEAVTSEALAGDGYNAAWIGEVAAALSRNAPEWRPAITWRSPSLSASSMQHCSTAITKP
jgi:hypothetical protein